MLRLVPWSVREYVLNHVPLGVYQRLVRRRVLSLCYHVVSDCPPAHIRHLFECKGTAAFEADMAYLARYYTLLRYEQVAEVQIGHDAAPANALLVTFDDGYAECFTTVRPLLLKYQVPCVFFVTTAFIDNRSMFHRNTASLCVDHILRLDHAGVSTLRGAIQNRFGVALGTREELVTWLCALDHTNSAVINAVCDMLPIDVAGYLRRCAPYLTTDQIRQLARDGFTIGAHSLTHPRLQDLPAHAEIEREIVTSCQIVRDMTGAEQVPFAFPHNGSGIDRAFLAEIRRRNSVVGLYFDSKQLQEDQPFVVQRIIGDAPRGARSRMSNLPYILRRLYIEQVRRATRRAPGEASP